MAKKKVNIKPSLCPYCGKRPVINVVYYYRRIRGGYLFRVICRSKYKGDHCCSGPPRKTPNGAITAWEARKVT